VIVLRTLNRNSVPNTVMIGPKPDSVNMYMHIIGINFSKDETKEFESYLLEYLVYIKIHLNKVVFLLQISILIIFCGILFVYDFRT
jgi:hypothetical protein